MSDEHRDLSAIIADFRARGMDTVRLSYADIHGIARSKDVPLGQFPIVVEKGMSFCAAGLTGGLSLSLASLPPLPAEPPLPADPPPVPLEPHPKRHVVGAGGEQVPHRGVIGLTHPFVGVDVEDPAPASFVE